MKRPSLVQIFLCLLTLTFIFGCAATTKQEFRHSDFLGDYSGFKPLKMARGANGYAKPGLDLSAYRKIMIDPVETMVAKEAGNQSVPADDLKMLGERFYQELAKELGKSFEVVDQPGPGVLRLRTALTDVVPKAEVGMTSGQAGAGYRPQIAQPGDTPETSVPISRASMEMELLDSASGERLGAIVDRKGQDLPASASKWEAVEAAFAYWAENVGDILGSLRGK